MRLALSLLVLAACVKSQKVTCGDRICPPQYTCDLANDRCISPDQIAACNGLADGADCVVDGAPGTCAAGACDPLVCGDGLVSGAEQCDGANLDGATCRDFHFYDDAGLACTAACTFDTSQCTGFCGDGIVNGGELCDGAPPPLGACFDFGYDAGPLGCGNACGASFDECARFDWRIEPIGDIRPLAGGGTSHSDAWLVGSGGAIAHYNGVAWALDGSPVTTDLVAVWAIAPGDAWAVGTGGVVLHRDATNWQIVPAPAADFTDVWAASDTAVFTATRDHEVQWWNGLAWQQLGTLGGGATVIRGTSANDVWAARSDGTLEHWNGTAWSPATLAGSAYSIAAVAPDDVWVAGVDASFAGLIAHWNGITWTTWTTPSVQYASVAAFGAVDAWVIATGGTAFHWDGEAWTPVPLTIDNFAAAAVALEPGEMLAVEYSGYAYRYTGQAFAHYNNNTFGPQTALWSASGTDIFVGVSKFILRNSPGVWSKSFTEPFGESIDAIAGTSASDIWTISADHLYHFDGTSWTEQPNAGAQNDPLLWVDASNVWTFSMGAAHHGPAPWANYAVGNGVWASVSGDSSNDLWAVQNDLLAASLHHLVHWDGTTWQTVTIPEVPIAVGARAPDDVFVSTTNLHILHWDGAMWSDTPVTTLHPLTFFATLAADDVFAASDLDLVHFDGTRWSRVRPDFDTTATNAQIHAMFAPTAGHIQLALGQFLIRDLLRTRPWVCRAHETNCSDGIDDDCDGKTDHDDSDCP